jgi:uroporphyrin-3 C-methyltransferase
MSKNKPTEEGQEKALEADEELAAKADESVVEPVVEPVAAEDAVFEEQAAIRKPRSGSGAIAWLALLMSSAALVAFLYGFMRPSTTEVVDTPGAAEIATLNAAVDATRGSLATLEQSVSALTALDGTRSAEVDALERQLNQRLRQMEALPGRVASIEGTISSLQGVSTGARDAWLLAEAEYYMQIANAQLQLAGNPHLATLALTLADERVLQLADPGLVEVRRSLSNELRALELMEKPDTEGITLTLASLAHTVDSLPLRQEITLEAGDDADIDPNLTGVDRAMASLKGAFGKVVSVRRTDEALEPLIAPEAQYFLRANLALQLQAARLAVLRNEENIFRQSLDDASVWLGEYYDSSNAAVRSAQQTIAEIRDSVFSVAIPDISESLRLLRQFNAYSAIAEQRQQPATAEDQDAVGETDRDAVEATDQEPPQ